MNIRLHLEIAGGALIALGLAHPAIGWYCRWREDVARTSLFARQVFYVHAFFIALVLMLFGALSLFYAEALLADAPLGRAVLAGMALFWLCRLGCQWFFYDSSIWRGNRFRTVMHVAFSLFWIYLVAVYAGAFLIRPPLEFGYDQIPPRHHAVDLLGRQ
jgi:hypothetical protein